MTNFSSPKSGWLVALALLIMAGLVSRTAARPAPRGNAAFIRDTVPPRGVPTQENVDTSKSGEDTQKDPEDGSDSRVWDAQLRANMREIQRQMAQVQVELARVSTEEVRLEVRKAMRESLDQAMISREAMERALEETRKNLRTIDREATERAMAESRKDLMAIQRETMDRSMAEIKRSEQILRKRQEVMREMIEEMRKDHLIDKSSELKFEFNHGKLYINGKEQPPAVNEKYKHYFQEDDQKIRSNQNDGTAI